MDFVFHDGGRVAAGYRGKTGDCVTRSIAIATGKTYQEVYDALNGLALLYASQKQPAKALDYANQALEIRRSLGDHEGEAQILAEIATGAALVYHLNADATVATKKVLSPHIDLL